MIVQVRCARLQNEIKFFWEEKLHGNMKEEKSAKITLDLFATKRNNIQG